MLGLIKKDFLQIKNNSKLIIVMLFVFFIMALQGEFDVSFIPPFIVVMLFMTTFSYDEYNKWNSYAITLPSGRKSIVKSKYIASLILVIITVIIAFLLNFLVSIINNKMDFVNIISIMMGSMFATILIQSIMYPFIFKFGMEKGRIALFVLSFIIVGIVGLFSEVLNVNVSKNVILLFNNYWFVFIPLVCIVGLLISYKISENIYLKKEF